jgi:hypothetical protein
MGNFSRNTFDPAKGYVSVRLQQGVPLVDADWNELSDVTRNEAYSAAQLAVADGAVKGFAFLPGGPNDPVNVGGSGCVDGRPFDTGLMRYDAQPWRDAGQAAADGVPVLPALTTPAADRTDVCYLDVWEREVGKAEDANLVNPAIGVETSVRLRRVVTMRVAEGTDTVPPAPPGHRHVPLALFRRQAGTDTITAQQRQPLLPPLNVASFVPAFHPYADVSLPAQQPWTLVRAVDGRLEATRPPNSSEAEGILPIQLPSGARMLTLGISGRSDGRIDFRLTRWAIRPGVVPPGSIVAEVAVPPGGQDFAQEFVLPAPTPATLPPGALVVDNGRFQYGLVASSRNLITNPDLIYGVFIAYSY